MKVFSKRLVVAVMVAVVCLFSMVSVFAAEGLEVNGVKDIKKDDIVTYTLNLSDCTEGIVGLQMYVIYDREYLRLESNSFQTPELDGVVSNTQGDYITFNWTDISKPADFSEKKVMVEVSFKVVKEGKTDITYFISEMYGEDMTYLKSYTFTYDLAVNDKIMIDDETPVITRDQAAQNKYQGMFVNYVDGKGEVNGKTDNNKERETVMGITEAPSTFETGAEITGDSIDKPQALLVVIIICVVNLLIALIIALAIFNKVNKRKKAALEEQDKTEDNSEVTTIKDEE